MAVLKTKVVSTVTLSDVKPGDVFEWVKDAGCRKKGELAVVKSASSDGSLEFYPVETSGNYGSVVWLQDSMNDGNVILRQTSKF